MTTDKLPPLENLLKPVSAKLSNVHWSNGGRVMDDKKAKDAERRRSAKHTSIKGKKK